MDTHFLEKTEQSGNFLASYIFQKFENTFIGYFTLFILKLHKAKNLKKK